MKTLSVNSQFLQIFWCTLFVGAARLFYNSLKPTSNTHCFLSYIILIFCSKYYFYNDPIFPLKYV